MINNKEILLFLKEAQEKGLFLEKSKKGEKRVLEVLNNISDNLRDTDKKLLFELESLILETIEDARKSYFKLGQIYKEIKKED